MLNSNSSNRRKVFLLSLQLNTGPVHLPALDRMGKSTLSRAFQHQAIIQIRAASRQDFAQMGKRAAGVVEDRERAKEDNDGVSKVRGSSRQDRKRYLK
jgi:hypothetical protein